MSYRFDPDESVGDALRRCTAEQLERAERELTQGIADDPVEAVHTARKAVKKERAILRLARGAITPTMRRRENAALRDAARRLSETRDAEVMVEALEDLAERYSGQLPEQAFAAGRRVYAEKPGALRRRLHTSWKAGRSQARQHRRRAPADLAQATAS